MNDLLELAGRVEAASGPDRMLDAEIMFDLFAKAVGKAKDGGPTGYLWPENDPSWSFGIRFPGKDRDWFSRQGRCVAKETLLIERDGALVLMNDLRIPRLTASLDAAMTLVPEGCWAEGSLSSPGMMEIHARAIFEPIGLGIGRTPALALTAAALRAHANPTRDEGKE